MRARRYGGSGGGSVRDRGTKDNGRDNSPVALDAATGREIWIHTGLNGIASRGIKDLGL